MSPAWLAPPFAPQPSLCAGELFNNCAGASVFDCASTRFVAITHRHSIAPPWQCDLLRRCLRRCGYRHRHFGHHHQGSKELQTQVAGQAKGSGDIGIPNGGMRKGPGDDRHWHFGMGWDGMGVLTHYCILFLLINTHEMICVYCI